MKVNGGELKKMLELGRLSVTVAAMLALLLAVAVSADLPAGLKGEEEPVNVESRQHRDFADALKELENIQKFWTQNTRPRFGRSEFKQHRPLATPFPFAAVSSRWLAQQAGADQQGRQRAADGSSVGRPNLSERMSALIEMTESLLDAERKFAALKPY